MSGKIILCSSLEYIGDVFKTNYDVGWKTWGGNIDWSRGGADVIIPVLSACLITCLNVRHISHPTPASYTQDSPFTYNQVCQGSWNLRICISMIVLIILQVFVFVPRD